MRKIVSIILAAMIAVTLVSCGDRTGSNNDGDVSGNVTDEGTDDSHRTDSDTATTSDGTDTADNSDSDGGTDPIGGGASGVLMAIWDKYGEDEKFASAGGDMDNSVMNGPGSFNIENTEDLDATLGLPQDLAGSITDAASLMHMMNANTFTSACYKLKEGTNVSEFTDALRKNIMARQWICGTPETYLAMNINDEYIVSAFGADDLIKTFKTNTQKAISTVSVISEEPIAA